MTKHQLRQLTHYSSLSVTFLFLKNTANTQVIYYDIDPDTVLQFDNDLFSLDMDDDGESDFMFWKQTFFTTSSWWMGETASSKDIFVLGMGANDDLAASQFWTGLCESCSTTFTAPYAIDTNVIINGSDFDFRHGGEMAYIVNSYLKVGGAGNWFPDTEDKFLGIRFDDSEGILHYGWIRCSVVDDYILIIKDYAWEAAPEQPIETGFYFTAEWTFITDGGVSGNGNDLHFGFNSPASELYISTYRVICVKDDAVDDFTMDDVDLLSADQYIEIPADGSEEYISSFNTFSRDSDGDLIVNEQPYRLFILQKMDVGLADTLLLPSPSCILSDSAAQASITLNDLYDNGTGADIKLNFTSPANKNGILEYRVMLVKEDSLATFSVEKAMNVLPENYFLLSPITDSTSFIAGASAHDTDGELISLGKYGAIVLSVADGIAVSHHTLSPPTTIETIEIATPPVTKILLEDISEFGDGRDIRISFPHIVPEQTIDQYRIFIMNVADAFDFDLDAAYAVDPDNYITLTPTGNDIMVEGESGTTDINGELITWGVPYFVYVVCIASQYGINDTLSAPSNELVINFPATESVNDPGSEGITAFSSGGQVHINFDRAPGTSSLFMLYDYVGRKTFEATLSEQHTVFDIDIPSGTYLAVIRYGDKTLSCPLLISK